MTEEPVFLKAFLQLWCRYPAFSIQIDHLKCIHEVEVALLSKLCLHCLQFAIMGDEFFQNSDELIFILNVERIDFW